MTQKVFAQHIFYKAMRATFGIPSLAAMSDEKGECRVMVFGRWTYSISDAYNRGSIAREERLSRGKKAAL